MRQNTLIGALLAAALPALGGETACSREDASREECFANPPASARVPPLHHGRVNEKVLTDAELATLKRMGFGGFTGNVDFDANYLGNASIWKTLRYTLGKALVMGMSFWLCDEKGYLSCAACGKTHDGRPKVAAEFSSFAPRGKTVAHLPVPDAADVERFLFGLVVTMGSSWTKSYSRFQHRGQLNIELEEGPPHGCPQQTGRSRSAGRVVPCQLMANAMI